MAAGRMFRSPTGTCADRVQSGEPGWLDSRRRGLHCSSATIAPVPFRGASASSALPDALPAGDVDLETPAVGFERRRGSRPRRTRRAKARPLTRTLPRGRTPQLYQRFRTTPTARTRWGDVAEERAPLGALNALCGNSPWSRPRAAPTSANWRRKKLADTQASSCPAGRPAAARRLSADRAEGVPRRAGASSPSAIAVSVGMARYLPDRRPDPTASGGRRAGRRRIGRRRRRTGPGRS